MRKYQRMTLAVRCHISVLLQEGYSISEIAIRLGYHKSSISREIKRNSVREKYEAERAERRYQFRRQKQGRKVFIQGSAFNLIKNRMKAGWSPEQICGRLKVEGHSFCCYQTIYNFIWKHKRNKTKYNLSKYLRRYNKTGFSRYQRKKLRYHNPYNLSISERPSYINNRSRIGDWERDCMYISERNQLVVLTERKSRLTMLKYIGKPTKEAMIKITRDIFKNLNHKAHSITQDNGSEFSGLPQEEFQRYRCDPLRPDQRGSVENSIGLLRQYLKLGTKKEEINDTMLNTIQDLINNRPRKVLNYKTALEVFLGQSVALVS